MGNQASNGKNDKNKKQDQPKKKPGPPPPRVGRKKKNKGVEAATKLPSGIAYIISSYANHKMQTAPTEARKNQRLLTDGRIIH